MAKKNGTGSYPVGHKDYGKMGPRTFDEYQSLNFRNKTIDKLKSAKSIVKDVEKYNPKTGKSMEKYNPKTGKSKMIYKPGKQ